LSKNPLQYVYVYPIKLCMLEACKMIYHVELLKGMFRPKIKFSQLKEAEYVKNITGKILLVLLLSAIISFLRAYYGIGTEELIGKMEQYTKEQFVLAQFFFALGHVLGGLIIPLLFLFLSSAIFFFLFDVNFVKLLAIHASVLLIYVLEEILLFPLQLFLGIKDTFSPFTLGVLGPYITDSPFVWTLLRSISLFSIWAMLIQMVALEQLTEKPKRAIMTAVIAVYVFFALLSAILTDIPFEKLL
jgi:hypothetical protein